MLYKLKLTSYKLYSNYTIYKVFSYFKVLTSVATFSLLAMQGNIKLKPYKYFNLKVEITL